MSKNLGVWDKAKRDGKRMSMITAYDHTFARLADEAGLDGTPTFYVNGRKVGGDE